MYMNFDLKAGLHWCVGPMYSGTPCTSDVTWGCIAVVCTSEMYRKLWKNSPWKHKAEDSECVRTMPSLSGVAIID